MRWKFKLFQPLSFRSLSFFCHQLEAGVLSAGGERTEHLHQPATHSGELIRAARSLGGVLAPLLTPHQHPCLQQVRLPAANSGVHAWTFVCSSDTLLFLPHPQSTDSHKGFHWEREAQMFEQPERAQQGGFHPPFSWQDAAE